MSQLTTDSSDQRNNRPGDLAIASAPGWLLRHGNHIDDVSGHTDDQLQQLVTSDHIISGRYQPDNAPRHVGSVAITAGRGWLTDCRFDEDTIDELFDWQIVRLVDRIYEGGWTAFLVAIAGLLGEPEPAPPHNESDTAPPTPDADQVATEMAYVIAKAAGLGVITDDEPVTEHKEPTQ